MSGVTTGRVYLIGAGPGDPGLLTLRGKACLERADVVVYDYLANATLLEYVRPEAERIEAGKRRGRPPGMPQKAINDLMIQRARTGKVVARLKGGDPFIFGRGGEEAEALADARVPFELVPGVTSATAVAAYAGIPLTHRAYSSSIALVTGHEDPRKSASAVPWDLLGRGRGRGVDTIVFFMGLTTLSEVVKRLRQKGRPPHTPIALIRWGTRPEQRTVTGTLKDIVAKARTARLTPPVLIVVGEVVRLREKLNWFETKALFGKKILVTRPRGQAGELSRRLSEAGAEPIACPTITIMPPDSWKALDGALARLSRFDWVIFTSANAVRVVAERLKVHRKDLRTLGHCRVCAIGPGTAQALGEVGIRPDVVPEEFIAEGVIAAMGRQAGGLKGRRILLPRAQKAREILPRALRAMGATVEVATAYKTGRPSHGVERIAGLLTSRQIAAITFTSASTVGNFVQMFGERRLKRLVNGVTVASIGPVTARAAARLGMKTDIMPTAYTIPALADAIITHFNGATATRKTDHRRITT